MYTRGSFPLKKKGVVSLKRSFVSEWIYVNTYYISRTVTSSLSPVCLFHSDFFFK